MRILRRLQMELIAGVVLALTLPLRAAEVERYLPDDTEVIMVVNAKQLLDSPLVKKHFQEHVRGFVKSEEASKILDSLGFDPLKDLSSITGAISVMGSDAKGLIIAHGKFDQAKFEAKAEDVAKEKADVLKIHKDGNRKFYEVKVDGGEKPVFVAVMDSMTLVAGPEKQYIVDAFAKGAGKKGAVQKEIQELIEKADAGQSLWFAATANAFLKGDLSSDDKAKKNLEKMNSITAGLTVEKGAKLSLAIATKSPANAKELAEEIKEGLNQAKGLLALVAEQNKAVAPLVDVVGRLRVNTEGSTITLQGEVSEELIDKALKKN